MRVVIIGAGPAGLLCANELVDHCEVEVVEQGPPLSGRKCDMKCRVCPFPRYGLCAVLHGEGGAGGYSDGKVGFDHRRGVQLDGNTFQEGAFHKRADKLMALLERLNPSVRRISPVSRPDWLTGSPFGFESYPLWHYGTDGIRVTIHALTTELTRRGCRFHYNNRNVAPESVLRMLHGGTEVILATGSYNVAWNESVARLLNVGLKNGPAGIGIRLEAEAGYLQRALDSFYDFKLHLKYNGIRFRSFCANGAGAIVNCRHSLFPDRPVITVNGRAESNRKGQPRANVAIMAKLDNDASKYETRFLVESISAHGDLRPIVQFAKEFLDPRYRATEISAQSVGTNPDTVNGRLQDMWPDRLVSGFREYLTELNHVLPGCVTSPSSVIYAPEIKYHGLEWPLVEGFGVRGVPGLHIVGNATGYTDSFTSAAVTGMACGEFIRKS